MRRRAVPGNQGSRRRRTRTSPRRDSLESRNETSAALETRDDSYYFRLSNDASVTSVSCFSSMPGISFTERLIDNQPAEATGQIVSIDCHFRRHSTLSKIASLTLLSFDYFSPVCNGVRPRVVDDVPHRKEEEEKRSSGSRIGQYRRGGNERTERCCGADVNRFVGCRIRLHRRCPRNYLIDDCRTSAFCFCLFAIVLR